MRVDRASGYKEAVSRLKSHRRFPFFLPYANARQYVKCDCGWMQMPRIDATWLVYRFIDCDFLICGVRHNNLQQGRAWNHSVAFLASCWSYPNHCNGSNRYCSTDSLHICNSTHFVLPRAASVGHTEGSALRGQAIKLLRWLACLRFAMGQTVP